MNEENFVQKFLHYTLYTDIVIFVLGHFIVTHPVYKLTEYLSSNYVIGISASDVDWSKCVRGDR